MKRFVMFSLLLSALLISCKNKTVTIPPVDSAGSVGGFGGICVISISCTSGTTTAGVGGK